MCPESERVERERKGDLDQYERMDVVGNKTSRSLAVKKYNGTAEEEASLIRPMPVLLRTIDYLLNFANQPYNDEFLGIYNFLSDRMRAIQMDLRMQHINSQHAIVMLEYMTRLHVIAMHELCECKKREGFLDGFDSRLVIEQIKETLLELFQMYDDQRKKGISLLTEKEFRGYYALLYLHIHPGDKVVSDEMFLSFAKMTSEIKGSREVRYANYVARACRTGNYIGFFQLARKATYLQACLMHAQFAKLRTQALASLHGSLQNNQGIPLARVVSQLAMEGEDIKSLLEYHGFTMEMYDVKYLVKGSLFLNSDVHYPSRCSKLIHRKRSRRIIDDMSSDPTKPVTSIEKVIPSDTKEILAYRTTEIPTVSDRRNEPAVNLKATSFDLKVMSVQRPTDFPTIPDMKNKSICRMSRIAGVPDLRGRSAYGTTGIPTVSDRKNEHVHTMSDISSIPDLKAESIDPANTLFSRKKAILSNLKVTSAQRPTDYPTVPDMRNKSLHTMCHIPGVPDLRGKPAHGTTEIPTASNRKNEYAYTMSDISAIPDLKVKSIDPANTLFSRKRTIPSDLKELSAQRVTDFPMVSDIRNNSVLIMSHIPVVPDLKGRPTYRTTEIPMVSDKRNEYVHTMSDFPAVPVLKVKSINPINTHFSREKASPSHLKETSAQRATDFPTMPDIRNESVHTMSHIPAVPDLKGEFACRTINASTSDAIKKMKAIDITSSSPCGENDDRSADSFQNGLDGNPFVGSDAQFGKSDVSRHEIEEPSKHVDGLFMQVETFGNLTSDSTMECPVPHEALGYVKENDELKCASSKLKIILRKRKARASLEREVQEQRLLFSKLSLGSPLIQSGIYPSHLGEKFDTNFIMREIGGKRRKLSLRMNVADAVGPILIRRLPNIQCICWKLLVCLHRSDIMDNLASTWLLSKVMGTKKENDDELVLSSSNLSIWRKLVEGHSFCFSIIREVVFDSDRGDKLGETVHGANAIVYQIAERTPWGIQRLHLYTLLMSIPTGSRLPLLILNFNGQREWKGGTYDPEIIIIKLGLLNVDKTRISSISVFFLSGVRGGFSADKLREGLQWLAYQCPLQSSFHLVRTRELVMKCLNSSLESVNNMKISYLDPERYITIFNEALERSAQQVQSATYVRSNHWQCPEIGCLKEKIVTAIRSCKLPSFSLNMSWLYLGKDLLWQKLRLEEHLINYLKQSIESMSGNLAAIEAQLILHTSVDHESHGLHCYITPRWLMIFQRIYDWRLMQLTGGEYATEYVLDHDET